MTMALTGKRIEHAKQYGFRSFVVTGERAHVQFVTPDDGLHFRLLPHDKVQVVAVIPRELEFSHLRRMLCLCEAIQPHVDAGEWEFVKKLLDRERVVL